MCSSLISTLHLLIDELVRNDANMIKSKKLNNAQSFEIFANCGLKILIKIVSVKRYRAESLIYMQCQFFSKDILISDNFTKTISKVTRPQMHDFQSGTGIRYQQCTQLPSGMFPSVNSTSPNVQYPK